MTSLILDVTDIASTPFSFESYLGLAVSSGKYEAVFWNCCLDAASQQWNYSDFNPDSQTSRSTPEIFSKMLISWVPPKIT